MRTQRLYDIAKTIRSKNAGVDRITFDVIFERAEDYRRVRDRGVLTRETVAALYRIHPDRITDFVAFDAANAIKFTLLRERPSGSAGDGDIFGAQQYAPLMDLAVPASSDRGPDSNDVG